MPPVTRPMIGMTMSLTTDCTSPLKAAPMMKPMARSTRLPLSANSLNSFSMWISRFPGLPQPAPDCFAKGTPRL